MIKRRTTMAGQTRYDVRFRDPNGRVRNTTFRTRAAAERDGRDKLQKLDQGNWIDPTQRARPFNDWAAEYLPFPDGDPEPSANTSGRSTGHPSISVAARSAQSPPQKSRRW